MDTLFPVIPALVISTLAANFNALTTLSAPRFSISSRVITSTLAGVSLISCCVLVAETITSLLCTISSLACTADTGDVKYNPIAIANNAFLFCPTNLILYFLLPILPLRRNRLHLCF